MTLIELAERCEKGRNEDNALDVMIEVALFVPDKRYSAVRPNAAGTKVVYTTIMGQSETCWAWHWTMRRAQTAAALRARAAMGEH